MWLGQLASQCGDRLTQLVLIAIVAAKAPGSTLTLAKVLVATSLPALLMNPFAGAYVDRWDRKKTMITCDLIRAGVIAILPWAAFSLSGITLYGAVFLLFAVASFFIPARLALIPDLVESRQLSQANSLFTSSGMIGSTLILLVGALLVEWLGPARGCLFTAASYLLSALFIVPIAPRGRPSPPGASLPLILQEIREGLKELWQNPSVRRVAGLLGFLTAGAGSSIVVGTVLIQKSLGSVTRDLGVFSLWVGIGMLTGSLAYGRWGVGVPRGKTLSFSFLGCGMAIWAFVGAVLGLRSGLGAWLSAWALGLWVAPIGIVANTLVHEQLPHYFHGRVFSSLGAVVNLSLIGSMLLAGRLVEKGGHGLFLITIGLAFAGGGLVLLYLYRSQSLSKPV